MRPDWVTGRHTHVEVSLAIQRRLGDAGRQSAVVALDDAVCRRAAELGIAAGSRALDALHLAAAERAGGRSLPVFTFDVRLAQAARALGFVVVGE